MFCGCDVSRGTFFGLPAEIFLDFFFFSGRKSLLFLREVFIVKSVDL